MDFVQRRIRPHGYELLNFHDMKLTYFKNSVTSKTTSHKTYWVAKARWVANRKVWTSSGVSAGTDAVIAWMSQVYGEDVAAKTCIWMEYNRETDPSNDPFAAIYDCKDVPFISV
jgi:hypothetical protein